MINKIKEKLKKRREKKGFTLVELLAVIVILAVIMVITIPTVLGNMKEAKQSAYNTVGDTMIKYIEDNYKNCKLGNKDIANYDDDIFDDKCEIRTDISEQDLSNNLINNSGYSTNDIEKVEISKYEDDKFGVVVYPNSDGQFKEMDTLIQGTYIGKCWLISPVNKNEYKLESFVGYDFVCTSPSRA